MTLFDYSAVKAEREEQARLSRISKIDRELSDLDKATMRPLRAIQNGTDDQYDRDRLADLETQAQALRDERAGLVA